MEPATSAKIAAARPAAASANLISQKAKGTRKTASLFYCKIRLLLNLNPLAGLNAACGSYLDDVWKLATTAFVTSVDCSSAAADRSIRHPMRDVSYEEYSLRRLSTSGEKQKGLDAEPLFRKPQNHPFPALPGNTVASPRDTYETW